jgi:hypothetical protein
MDLNIAREVAALRRMTVKELRSRYAEVFGEPTNGNHKVWLTRRIAWRLQALAEGDLSERARRRAAELANDADLRLNPPKAPPAASPEELPGKGESQDFHRMSCMPFFLAGSHRPAAAGHRRPTLRRMGAAPGAKISSRPGR